MSSSSWVAIKKIPYTEWLKQLTFISSLFWRLEVQDQEINTVGLCEGSLPGIQTTFLLCTHMADGEQGQAHWCLFFKWHQSHPWRGPYLLTSSKPKYTLKPPSLNIPGLGLQHMNFLWDTIQSKALNFNNSKLLLVSFGKYCKAGINCIHV